MILNNPRIIHLDHGVSFTSAAPLQSLAAAATVQGSVTLWQPADAKSDPQLNTLNFGRLLGISLHPSHPFLAVVEEAGKLRICDLDGSARFNLDPPERRATGSDNPASHNCLFDAGGEHLWCVSRMREDQFEVQVRRVTDLSIISTLTVVDPFRGRSWASLFQAEKAESVALWLSTGQTETQVYWLTYSDADGLACDEEPNLEWTWYPVFSPDGQEFLVPTGLDGLARYRWSKKRWGQNLRCPGRPNDSFTYFLEYLDDTYAITGTHLGRVHLVQSKTMRIVDELVIEGHEIKVRDGSRVNSKENSFYTELSGFWKIGDCIAFAFPARRRDRQGDCEDFLLFDVDGILAHID